MIRRTIRMILIVGSLAVLAALIIELVFRVSPTLRPSYVQQQIEAVYKGDGEPGWSVPDDELGFLGKPSRHVRIKTIDYSYTSETDQFGFANSGPWPEQADIVFLGDSLLTGAGVGLDGQFTTLVAKRLPASVVNLGLPGAAPAHLLRIFQRFGAGLHPKLVVACLYVASDVDNAKVFDAWQKAGKQWDFQTFRTYHYPEALAKIRGGGAGAAVGDIGDKPAHATRGFKARLSGALVSTAVGYELRYVLAPWRDGLLHEVKWPDGSRVYLSERFQKRLAEGMGDEYPSISEIFFGPLVTLRAAVRSSGASFVVALIPSKEEIFHAKGNTSTLRIVKEVRRHLDELDMPVLDLYPAIIDAGRTTAPFFAHDIHLDAAGNAAVANAVVKWASSSGALRSQ